MTRNSRKEFKVLFVSGCEGDTQRYRCLHPQEQLELNRVHSTIKFLTDFHVLSDVLDYDIFILHRVPYNDVIGDLLELIYKLGKVAIFDIDDLLFEPGLVQYIALFDSMSPEEAFQFRQTINGYSETLERCEYVLTPTEFLAEMARKREKKAFVNRNSLSNELIQISQHAYALARTQRLSEKQGNKGTDKNAAPVVIGYFSGTGSHNKDFLEVTDALVQVMGKYTNVELHIGGHLLLSEKFANLQDRIKGTPYLSWRELPYVMSTVNINLAPLELDNPFCRGKSELKYVEAGIVGVPTIASRIDAYEFAITHGVNGLLASNTAEWIESLELLMNDEKRRVDIGERAREDIHKNYIPEVRGRELLATLEQIQREEANRLPRLRAATRVDENPQRLVITCLQKHLTQQGKIIEAKEAQLAGQRELIRERDRQLTEQRKKLAEHKRVLQERDKELAEHKRVLQERDKQIAELEERLRLLEDNRRNELASILSKLRE